MNIKIILPLHRVVEIQYIITLYNNVFKKKLILETIDSTNSTITFLIKNIENFDEVFGIGFYYGSKIYKENGVIDAFIFMEDENYPSITFKVMSNDDKLILNVIDEYNKLFLKEITAKKFDYDEVIFAEIEAENIFIEDIFYLGMSFGSKAQEKREKGEIDW